MHIGTLTCVRICTYFAYRTTNSQTFINLSDRTGSPSYERTQTGMALTVETIPTFVCLLFYSLAQVEAKQEVTAVARTALVTLAGFVDWINMQHITDDDSHLLRILCQELGNPELGLYAAECLLLIVSRKVMLVAL